MSSIISNKRLGDSGERIGLSILGQVLGCSIQKWETDVGLEAPVQFRSTAPGNSPLYCAVQVKTGFSYAKLKWRNHWQIKNLNKQQFESWRSARPPVIFLWVHPELPNTVLWHHITPETAKNHFYISDGRRISPATPFDLTMTLYQWPISKDTERLQLLGIPLSTGIRPFAKDFYRKLMKAPAPIHPLLGKVRISWNGWRHITSQGRRSRHILQSFQLLPVLRWAIEHPQEQSGFRRLKTISGEDWTYERRLITFRTETNLAGRSNATVEYVIRETIRYPNPWLGVPNVTVQRNLSFESIYEKEEIKRSICEKGLK